MKTMKAGQATPPPSLAQFPVDIMHTKETKPATRQNSEYEDYETRKRFRVHSHIHSNS